MKRRKKPVTATENSSQFGRQSRTQIQILPGSHKDLPCKVSITRAEDVRSSLTILLNQSKLPCRYLWGPLYARTLEEVPTDLGKDPRGKSDPKGEHDTHTSRFPGENRDRSKDRNESLGTNMNPCDRFVKHRLYQKKGTNIPKTIRTPPCLCPSLGQKRVGLEERKEAPATTLKNKNLEKIS